jgi:branched-chain amino acid transport system substrate-binding protein
MNNLHIGLLLPSSGILPMSKYFEKGLKEGLANYVPSKFSGEITEEFIGQGGLKQTENAIVKLCTYDDVDLITGIISNKSAENFSSKFLSTKKTFLINNLGENIPDLNELNPFVFTNSVGLWQHAWSMGYWGVKTFGKKGMYVSSIYDAGYSFSHMFHDGMKAADAESDWSFSVTPMPSVGQLSDISVVFPFIDKYEPDFIFATFCGAETTLFINEFISRGLHKKIKLLGLPFLLEPFLPLKDDITIYTSISKPFLQANNMFYQLGYQTADFIHEASLVGLDRIQAHLKQLGKAIGVGETTFLTQNENGISNITIVKNEIEAMSENIKTENLAEVETFPLSQLTELTLETKIGWNNPYLCV